MRTGAKTGYDLIGPVCPRLFAQPTFFTWLAPLVWLALFSGLGGCAAPEKIDSHAEWLHETTRTWPGETQERLIAAAERVLKAADPEDVRFDYGSSGFRVIRPWLIYAVVASQEGRDTWSFRASETGSEARAFISFRQAVSEKVIVPLPSPDFRRVYFGVATSAHQAQQHSIGTYRLFFARMEYMLGKRKDWLHCIDAPHMLKLDPEAPGLEGLCGITFQGDETRPPPRVPKAVQTPRILPKTFQGDVQPMPDLTESDPL
jgi:hypothetical protein